MFLVGAGKDSFQICGYLTFWLTNALSLMPGGDCVGSSIFFSRHDSGRVAGAQCDKYVHVQSLAERRQDGHHDRWEEDVAELEASDQAWLEHNSIVVQCLYED